MFRVLALLLTFAASSFAAVNPLLQFDLQDIGAQLARGHVSADFFTVIADGKVKVYDATGKASAISQTAATAGFAGWRSVNGADLARIAYSTSDGYPAGAINGNSFTGVDATGATDSFAGITAALAAASATNPAGKPGGGLVYLSPGKYQLSAPLNIPTQCGILGAGGGANSASTPESDGAATVLFTTAAIDSVVESISAGARQNTQVRLLNCYIDAGATATYGVHLSSVSHSEIGGCTIRGATTAALFMTTQPSGSFTPDSTSGQNNFVHDISISEITSPACDSADGVLLDANSDNAGNTSLNVFMNIVANHRNGAGVHLKNCDGNDFYHIRTSGRSGTTGYGMVFDEDTSGSSKNSRNNHVFGCQLQPNSGVGGVHFVGSGVGTPSSLNYIYGYSLDNGSPVPTMDANGTAVVETEAGIRYYTHLTTTGPTLTNLNVSSKNWVDADTTSGTITFQGINGGIKGQVVSIWNTGTNSVTFANNNASGGQKFFTTSGANVVVSAKGVTRWYCDGSNWYQY